MINPSKVEHYIIKYILTNKPDFILFFDELEEDNFLNEDIRFLYSYLKSNHKKKNGYKVELYIIEHNAQKLVDSIMELDEIDDNEYTVESLIEIVKVAYLAKSMQDGLNVAIKKNYTLDEKIALLKENMKRVDSVSIKTEISSSDVTVGKYEEYIAEVIKLNEASKTGLVGLPTGVRELDKKINGIKKQDFIIIGARPSMGKTALLIRLFMEAIREGDRIPVMFSLEMPAEQIIGRLIAQIEKTVGLASSMYAEDYEENKELIEDTLEFLKSRDFYIEDFIEKNGESKSRITPSDIRKKLKEIREEIYEKYGDSKKIGLVAVDYLQLLHPSYIRQGMSTNDIMGEISKDIKALIREFQSPVVALSQLSRDLEKRQDKRPQMSDLRDSGAIEQDADIIMFVYRPAVYLEKELKEQMKTKPNDQDLERQLNVILNQPVSDAEIIIGKQRNGPIGTVYADFYKKCSMFGDVESFVGDVFEDNDVEVYSPIYDNNEDNAPF